MTVARRPYLACFGILVGIYLVASSLLLAYTDGLPYVYDNNESFSSLWHAHNLYYFGLEKSAGLTDEAYGPDPNAHPFVHTHQGNFPRLFAFLIFALGARSVESQIVVTTLTIGLLSVLMTYHVLSTMTRPLFGLIACLVFLSDYLGYAQWHVVTYRVWHMFLLFGALLCVQQIRSLRDWKWLALMSFFYACLFYFELIFALFTAVSVGLYAATVHWRRIWLLVSLWVIQGLSGVLSISILVLQLSMHLGSDVALQDITLTFFARNSVGTQADQISRLRDFFDAHNIVFFYNVMDVSGYRTISKFFEMHFLWYFQNYSPLFVLLVLILVGGWFVGLFTWRGQPVHVGSLPAEPGSVRAFAGGLNWHTRLLDVRLTVDLTYHAQETWSTMIGALRALGVIVVLMAPGLAMAWLVVSVLRDNTIFGLALTDGAFFARTSRLAVVPVGLASAGIMWLSFRLAHRSRNGFTFGTIIRTFLAALFIVVVTVCIRSQSAMYEPVFQPLWFDALSQWLPQWVSRAAVLAAVVVAVSCILCGSRGALGRDHSLGGLLPYLAAVILGYVAVYIASPGYVFSGYLVRGAPLFVFIADVLMAIPFTILAVLAVRFLSEGISLIRGMSGQSASGSSAVSTRRWLRVGLGCSVGLLAFVVVFWVFGRYVFGSVGRSNPGLMLGMSAMLALVVVAGLAIVTRVALLAPSGSRMQDLADDLRRLRRSSVVHERLALSAGVAGLLVFLLGYWAHMQMVYVAILPPTHFQFMKMLAEPPYRGFSFAVNTYAAPIAAYTGQWAYITPTMAASNVVLGDQGFVQTSDPDAYIWLADRRTNTAYARPDYFLCMQLQQPALGIERLTGRHYGGEKCATLSIVKAAEAADSPYLKHRIVARDTSPYDLWVIIKLDWDLPPFLAPLNGASRPRVQAVLDGPGGSRSASVRYVFSHQDGQAERDSVLRLVRRQPDGSRCVVSEQLGGDRVLIPDGMAGDFYVTVTPRTATKSGQEYSSAAFHVDGGLEQPPLTCLSESSG